MNRIIECYLDAWRNWNNFSGRTRRSGYWYAFLANVIIVFVLGILAGIADIFEVVSGLYSLVYLVPSLALTTRRLHDTNHSAWWLRVICLVPGVCGAIIAVAAGVALALAFSGGSAGGLVALILVKPMKLFPACAGVIPGVAECEHQQTAFPRMCGGDPGWQCYGWSRQYFSPHVRG